jgi:MFS family permease
LIALFIGFVGIGYFDLELTSYLVSLGCTPQLASWIFIISSFTYAVASLAISRIPPSVDKRIVIFIGIVTTAAGFALMGPLPPLPQSMWIIALGSALEGAGLPIIIGTV